MRRRALDEALRRRAAEHGVIMERGTVVRARLEKDAVTLERSEGAVLRGRVVVGADGPRSMVRHSLGLDGGPPRVPRYALRQHFEVPAGDPLPTRVEVNALRGYELYVTPVAPHLIAIAALCEKRVLDAGSGNPEMRLRRLIDASPEVAMRVNGDVERAHRQAAHARLTHPPTW